MQSMYTGWFFFFLYSSSSKRYNSETPAAGKKKCEKTNIWTMTQCLKLSQEGKSMHEPCRAMKPSALVFAVGIDNHDEQHKSIFNLMYIF